MPSSVLRGHHQAESDMEQEIYNFARFYALLKRLKGVAYDDQEEFKKHIVNRYTNGRADNLRFMHIGEYNKMCNDIDKLFGWSKVSITGYELRQWRSTVLHLLQKMGIDTSNWATVDAYCRNPRIAGKIFCRLSADELKNLSVKLRMIKRKV